MVLRFPCKRPPPPRAAATVPPPPTLSSSGRPKRIHPTSPTVEKMLRLAWRENAREMLARALRRPHRNCENRCSKITPASMFGVCPCRRPADSIELGPKFAAGLGEVRSVSDRRWAKFGPNLFDFGSISPNLGRLGRILLSALGKYSNLLSGVVL